MSEPRPHYAAHPSPAAPSTLTGWRARLIREAEKAVKNHCRPAIIVLRYDGDGHWQVIPAGPPAASIDTEGA